MAENADATAREFGLECCIWDESRLARERVRTGGLGGRATCLTLDATRQITHRVFFKGF